MPCTPTEWASAVPVLLIRRQKIFNTDRHRGAVHLFSRIYVLQATFNHLHTSGGVAIEQVKKTTPTEVDRLEASRRAAQARVASVRHLEAARKERMHLTEQQCMRQKEAEARAKASALRSAAVARAVMAATYMRRREQELQEITEAEAHAKRERVAGVLAPKDSEVLDRERQLRVETYRRIRQQERRKEAAQKHQEEMIRQDEVRRTIPAPSTIHSARSCFSITGSTVSQSNKGPPFHLRGYYRTLEYLLLGAWSWLHVLPLAQIRTSRRITDF